MQKAIFLIWILLEILFSSILISCQFELDNYFDEINNKKALIVDLINNPEQLDSIVHKSEFYHPKYSIIIDENSKFIKKMLGDFKEKISSYNFDDSVYFYDHSKSTFHDFAISYNAYHHFGVYFEQIDSSWYLKLIAPINERIEFKEKNFEKIINKLIDDTDSVDDILNNSSFINSSKFNKINKIKSISDLKKIKMHSKEVEKILYLYDYDYVEDISDITCVLSITYYFNIENMNVNENILTTEFYYYNSNWYLKSIEMGSKNPDDYR